MKLVIGLGNPGAKYDATRHNVGFRIVDEIARKRGVDFLYKKKFDAEVAKDGDVMFVKPQTYMNNSGRSVCAIAEYFNVPVGDVIVVFDDKDIDFGTVRLRSTGSSGGHNGVQSVIQCLGDADFIRVRVGVANEIAQKRDTGDFVLARFSAQEEPYLDDYITLASNAVEDILANGITKKSHRDIRIEVDDDSITK